MMYVFDPAGERDMTTPRGEAEELYWENFKRMCDALRHPLWSALGEVEPRHIGSTEGDLLVLDYCTDVFQPDHDEHWSARYARAIAVGGAVSIVYLAWLL